MTRIDAAVLRGPRELGIETLDLADPKADEVLVDVRATGVCHTDYHRYTGDADVETPVVLGHEGAGVVEAVGDAVRAVEPGDRVVLTANPSCGTCPACAAGEPYHCEPGQRAAFGGHLLDGTRRLTDADGAAVNQFFAQASFAEKAVVPERTAIPVDERVPFEVAALLGCGAQTGIGAVVNTADVDAGDTVAVFGCGGLGMSAISAADAVGAGEIVAVDVVAGKLDRAAELGATETVDASEVDPVELIEEATGGGVDHAFEFTGDTTAMEQAFAAARRGGQALVSGAGDIREDISIPPADLLLDKRLRGNLGGSTRPRVDVPRYAEMYLRGDVDLDALVSRTCPLSDLEDAFEAMATDDVVRSVITFD